MQLMKIITEFGFRNSRIAKKRFRDSTNYKKMFSVIQQTY